MLPPGCGLESGTLLKLPVLWQEFHARGELHGGVVVEPGGAGDGSIMSFGMAVFVQDAFLTEALDRPRPYLHARVYERISNGVSPLVPPREIAAVNTAGGLNLLILHFGLRPGLTEDRLRAVLSAVQAGFRISHGGYRLRRVLQEAYGASQLPFMERGGFLLKSSYEDDEWAAGIAALPAVERPYLMGLYRDDPESRHPGAALADLFRSPRPRLFFSPAEQRVLLHALLDESDAAIAEALGVSHDAVKKVWRRIYSRVVAVDPGLLGPSSEDGMRGREKRRELMRYVRYHLEELRPFKRRDRGLDDVAP